MTKDLSFKRERDNLRILISHCNSIENAISRFGHGIDDFAENTIFQYSCAFSVQQIGDTIRRIPSKLKNKHPEIDWKELFELGEAILYNYDRIGIPDLWKTITEKVPKLKKQCSPILILLEAKL